ncbi:MAG: phenylalanine--tRNA ligase subunit beta [Candidatus Ancaeobacter aquaticus]|nr:phenylalanine--tRNA ligase subunit beta [Candidatus Ancaeobacter aquaticus]
MLVSYKWLKEFVDCKESPSELADILTMGGVEVESVEDLGEGLENVVVGKIMKIDAHPNADRLSVCTVDVSGETLTIVCGAKNMIEGDHVPVARIGATLCGGMKIEKTVLRGVTSCGMMCSAKELGRGDEHHGLLILDRDTKIGSDIKTVLGLDDYVLSLGVTPNRPDCLSIIGVAREVALLTGAKLCVPSSKDCSLKSGKSEEITVAIKNKELCPCYTGQTVRNVTVSSSPKWLQQRLEHVGLRSINNIVDITNYVLFECGHPIHAFDYDLIEGKEIIIRNAAPKESITTIDEVRRDLDAEMLVIADKIKPVALAGVMGGNNSEISDTTKNIFIESAYFIPSTVRRTSKKLGLSSDSSYRFERGVDPYGLYYALSRATELIEQVAGGSREKNYSEDKGELASRTEISVRVSRVNRMLGTELSQKEIKNIIKKLGCTIKDEKDNTFHVDVPTNRVDITQEADMIEEIARIYGYINVPMQLPRVPISVPQETSDIDITKTLRENLISQGLMETISYSFINKNTLNWLVERRKSSSFAVLIMNPISDEQNVMRTTLIPSMLDTLALNYKRGAQGMKCYELGNIYTNGDKQYSEKKKVLIGCMGEVEDKKWYNNQEDFDFFYIKGIIETLIASFGLNRYSFIESNDNVFQPGMRSDVYCGEEKIGVFGKVHPEVCEYFDIKKTVVIAELDVEGISQNRVSKVRVRDIPKYPSVTRDIALVIDCDCPSEKVINIVQKFGSDLVKDIKLFDIFKGGKIPENKKSAAYRICYRSNDRTLTDDEVNEVHSKIVKKLHSELNSETREM